MTKLKETIYTVFKFGVNIVEVFKNPTYKDIRVTTKASGKYKYTRGSIDSEGNLYIWRGDIPHAELNRETDIIAKWTIEITGSLPNIMYITGSTPIQEDDSDIPMIKRVAKQYFPKVRTIEFFTLREKNSGIGEIKV